MTDQILLLLSANCIDLATKKRLLELYVKFCNRQYALGYARLSIVGSLQYAAELDKISEELANLLTSISQDFMYELLRTQ